MAEAPVFLCPHCCPHRGRQGGFLGKSLAVYQLGCLCLWLQKKVKDWEQYEGEKTSLLQYLKKAESELEKPPETLAQESAQKELHSKKVSCCALLDICHL